MTGSDRQALSAWVQLRSVFSVIAMYLVIGVATVALLLTLLAATGLLPWPMISAAYGPAAWPDAGMWMQIGVTALLLLLCVFLPANARMVRLESSHRDFTITMDDVARAYAIAHAADRKGTYALSSEFDAVRERIRFMRKHPDLAALEPAVLEVAAQMSKESRALAEVYSDDKVARARAFLTQRQEEVQAMKDRIAVARLTCDELRRWRDDVVAEERVAETQIQRLEADLREVLPMLGYALEDEPDNVVQMSKPQK